MQNIAAVPAEAFLKHPNIQELICDASVKKIERRAFAVCPSLRRVIMPGVKVVERAAFTVCEALTYIECGKLEIVGYQAFYGTSLRSINLPSARIVEELAFNHCQAMKKVKFSNKLERIVEGTFYGCTSLERISLPLKDSMITADNIFQGCKELKRVDLVEGAILNKTVAALLWEEWKNDMNEEIYAINQNLVSAPAGNLYGVSDEGGKARTIRRGTSSVLRKIVHYKAEHQRILNEAATTLHHVLPHDIVLDNVLSFLDLPSYTFDGEG